MSNSDERLKAYAERIVNIMKPAREAKEIERADLKDLKAEMKSNDLTKAEIKGVMLLAKRSLTPPTEEQTEAEAVYERLKAEGFGLFAAAFAAAA